MSLLVQNVRVHLIDKGQGNPCCALDLSMVLRRPPGNRTAEGRWGGSGRHAETRRTVGVTLAILLLSMGCGHPVGPREEPVRSITGVGIESIDKQFVAFMEKWGVPGAAVGVVKDGRLVVARGYGLADLDAGEPVQPTSLFRIASVSKPITGIATLKLVDDGALDLEAKVFTLLADLLPANGPADQRLLDMTVRQLLHHTAGWDRDKVSDPMFRQREIARTMGVPSPPSAETIVRWLATQPLEFTPGTKFKYHNITYTTLGRVIEAVTGITYEEYVQSAVFAAVGVTRAQIGNSKRRDRVAGEVVYYADEYDPEPSVFDDEPGEVPFQYGGMGDIRAMDAHGGWIASVVDLLRLTIAVDGDPSTPELLSREMQNYMVANPGSPFSGEPWYGAGWFANSQVWDHTGSLPGTASLLRMQRDGIMVAAAVNMRGPDDFFNDFIGGLLAAVQDVNEWPSEDLFSRY